MRLLPAVNKVRKPKFELHLKIYDLNNVPLVSGVSLIKWHLPHSIHGEHRGRTSKCPIADHRVEYNYGRVVPVRISIDRANALSECPIEFEVLQEFGGAAGRDEKIVLGTVRLNLSEYIEESEAVLREGGGRQRRGSFSGSVAGDKLRLKTTVSTASGRSGSASVVEPLSPKSSATPAPAPAEHHDPSDVQDGVVRRYLMQESKINSTLKIGILMIQVDGERNFVAPPLKTAPVFGGIAAGFMAGDQAEQDETGQLPNISKPRDVSELQDMYRRSLVASWASPPGELLANECIEDIFAGGNGFETGSPPPTARGHSHSHSHSHSRSQSHQSHHHHHHRSGTGGDGEASSGSGGGSGGPGRHLPREDSGSASGDEGDAIGSLRPREEARSYRHHARRRSGGSEKSSSGTIVMVTSAGGSSRAVKGLGISSGGGGVTSGRDALASPVGIGGMPREDSSATIRPRAESTASVTTLGNNSDRGRDGFKRSREVQEAEVRDDMMAWQLPGTAS